MENKIIENVIKEIEGIVSDLETGEIRTKYNNFAKAVLLAHYFLFITVVWKSFDLHGDIPVTAKLSILFFGVGAFFSVLRYLADYFSECVGKVHNYKRLIEIEDEHGDALRAYNLEEYRQLKAVTHLMKWAMTREETKDIPPFIYSLVYFLLDAVTLIISFGFLCLGLILLGVSVI